MQQQIEADLSGYLALLKNLQNNLCVVARAAELDSPEYNNLVQNYTNKSLKLIDSYISTIMYESGQQALELYPVGVGNIVYDLSRNIKLNFDKNLEVRKITNQPIMSNSSLLGNSLFLLSEFLLKITNKNLIIKASHGDREKINIQIYCQNLKMFKKTLNNFDQQLKFSHMPYAKYSDNNGLNLVIASKVINILGGSITPTSNSKFSGFLVGVPLSKQLSLV